MKLKIKQEKYSMFLCSWRVRQVSRILIDTIPVPNKQASDDIKSTVLKYNLTCRSRRRLRRGVNRGTGRGSSGRIKPLGKDLSNININPRSLQKVGIRLPL